MGLFGRRKKGLSVDYSLAPLPESFKKKEPACGSCGYDAEHLLRLGPLERLFCDRCLTDALLDAIAFQTTSI